MISYEYCFLENEGIPVLFVWNSEKVVYLVYDKIDGWEVIKRYDNFQRAREMWYYLINFLKMIPNRKRFLYRETIGRKKLLDYLIEEMKTND